jgi:hypothetical protein
MKKNSLSVCLSVSRSKVKGQKNISITISENLVISVETKVASAEKVWRGG